MKSMTGYGRATAPLGSSTLTVQVSAVNRKTLDLDVLLPGEWEVLEADVCEAVRRVAARGKVLVRIEVSGSPGAGAITWDETAVANVLRRLQDLAEAQGLTFAPTPELLWQVASAHRQNSVALDAEAGRESVLDTLEESLRAFVAMRAREGEALLIDFLARLDVLRRLTEAIALRAPEVAPAHREVLLKRLRDSGLELDPGDERVLKEIALFAERCDVTEELTRLRSHLEQLGALLRSDSEIGRKAEFLLQEMGREVNTIGSKANDLSIARHVIDLKNELDRVREQIANVE
ncbi:MAG: YicC/YloC family endoribonuclease [Opitutales bacterium]